MADNIKYHSYNNYKYIEIWYGDRDKGKFIISTVSEREADTVVNELNTLLSENIRLEKENKELQEQVQEQEQRKWACLKEAHRLDLENEQLKQQLKTKHLKELEELTEKRFILAFDNYDGWAMQDTIGEYSDDEDYFDWLTGQKAVDVMNHFAEENEQLKTLIKALKKSNTDYVNQIKKAYDEGLSIKELADNCGVDLE